MDRDRDWDRARGPSPQQYGTQRGRGGDSGGRNSNWGNAHSDTAPLYDNRQQGGKQYQKGHGNQGRRARSLHKLWEHVKSVHAGDAEGGRHMPSEMSVEELVRVCSSLPPDASAVAAVSSALAYLDSRAMAALMKELAKTQQLARAMEIFDWLKSLPADNELYGLCDVYTFTTAISLMGPSQQLRRALELVGEMRARGLQCNVHTYSALMNVCIKLATGAEEHLPAQRRHMMRRLRLRGGIPFTTAENGCATREPEASRQCDACDLALDVFKQMHQDQIRPNVVTYNTLVDVYGKTGQWEKAVGVLDDMRQEEIWPEVRTFNTAIIACNMCGQPQEALKVYQKLLDAGLQPISTTYTALISAFGKAGQLDKALETFQTMIQQGCERSVITYSALISACEKAGRWELALDLFDQMQHEGCNPNTVTYNSLITACQQGGQAEKACEVFEQMKYNGCRPDVVTYSALISAYNRSGQWHRAIKAFEQMQQHNCKPDSYVYQTVIDSLWNTGISWAQLRAWQLYAAATRNWQYRFTVQQANSSNPRELEYVVPTFTPGVAVLALRKWVADLVGQVESDSTLLGATRDRMVLSLGRSKHVREPNSSTACHALLAVLAGMKAPFRPTDGAVSATGNAVVAEADMFATLAWLRNSDLPELLVLLVPPSVSCSRQPSPLGPNQKRITFAAELSDDSKLEDSCQRAYNTVLEYELVQVVQPQSMVDEYMAERAGLVQTAFQLAAQLDLAEEVVFDAVLLMDRVMSTGTAHDSNLGSLFVAASLRLAALQTVSSSDAQTLTGVPTDEVLAAAVSFPPGSVSKMEENIKAALSSDTKSISMLRTLKLYLERMGADKQHDVPAATHFNSGLFRLLRTVLVEPVILRWRPAVLAAAVLVAARRTVGCHPFLPACLEQLTGLRAETPELAAAAAALEPFAVAAGLQPPARASPVGQFGPRPPSAGPLFGNMSPSYNGSCSGYSSPSHAGTPTAAAAAVMAAQMQFGLPQKSLLDAVARQHGVLHHASSDMSSLSAQTCSDAGSAADLQALLSASAFAGAAAAAAGSPLGPNPLLSGSASEPLLAAALAGLQLGMMQHGSPPLAPQMPWVGGAGGFDAFHGSFPQQQGGGSRLQQMTSPYVMPSAMQQAYMFNKAARMQR